MSYLVFLACFFATLLVGYRLGCLSTAERCRDALRRKCVIHRQHQARAVINAVHRALASFRAAVREEKAPHMRNR